WDRNDIYIMPVLDFVDRGRSERVHIYEDFVRNMLEHRQSWSSGDANVGMAVPWTYPRGRMDRLFDLYRDEGPTFVAVDLDNGRLDRPGDVVGPVLEHFIGNGEERFFMYGFDARPYGRGVVASPAWDVYLAHASFNAFGPMSPKPHESIIGGDWKGVGRIFDPTDLTYWEPDEGHRDQFTGWTSEVYGDTFEWEYDMKAIGLYHYLRRYNFAMLNGVLGRLSEAIDEGDPTYIRHIRDHMPSVMKGRGVTERSVRPHL
ncbi:MAG: hypothetical protein MJZ68_10195, partial [archaeon]|nr:hypothetical protein [archaeon]